MFLSEDVWRKSGMGKGKGQYVLWDGETKRGYDRLRGHCIHMFTQYISNHELDRCLQNPRIFHYNELK